MPPHALAACLLLATAAPTEPELVRPDREAPTPRLGSPPLVAVTPPDLVPPVISEQVWRAQRRKLKIQAAVSWTFATIGLAGLTVPLVVLGMCGTERDVAACPGRRESLIAAPIFATVALASLVPAVIFTDRLVYQRTPERAPRLGFSPGGLVLRF